MAVNNIYITFVSNIYDKLLCPKYMKHKWSLTDCLGIYNTLKVSLIKIKQMKSNKFIINFYLEVERRIMVIMISDQYCQQAAYKLAAE